MVESLLLNKGPGLSSRIRSELVAKGLSQESARQRVSRTRGDVRRLTGLSFPRNEAFLYHSTQHNTDMYWDALLRDITEKSPAYRMPLASILARGGIVLRSQFETICGSPIRQKRHVPAEGVLQRLLKVGLLNQEDISGVGQCLALPDFFLPSGTQQNISFLKARLITENILLHAIKDWVRKLNFISYNKVLSRANNDVVEIGTTQWDLGGPSYLSPMVRFGKGGEVFPGSFVCDVQLGKHLTVKDLEYFFSKWKLTKSLKGMAPVLPVFIGSRFDRDVLHKGRAQGMVITTPKELFGEEVADGLESLLATLTDAANAVVKKPEQFVTLFNKLGKIEGAASNLRGAFFELLVGHCVKQKEKGFVEIGKKVTDSTTGRKAEIDVFRVHEKHEVCVYECKGHKSVHVVNQEECEKWAEDRVPLIFKALKEDSRYRNCSFRFEYWTCGTLTEDAKRYLESISKTVKRYELRCRVGKSVLEYTKRVQEPALIDMLNEHYYNHPFTAIST